MINQGMVCGTGFSNLPQPGDPSSFTTLRASASFGGINIRWTYPLINPYAVAHTILYRGLSANFAQASELSVVAGNSYYDQSIVDESTVYFYWITSVSVNGTVGELVGPASASANSTVGDMIELLTDRIDRGVLAQSLKTEIDRITTLAEGISQEATYRRTDDEALADAFNGLQASMDSTVSLVLQETHVRSTADSSLAQQITTVQSQLGNNLASVQTLMQTNINVTNGHVTSIGALYTAKVSVNGLIGGFGVYNDGTEVQAGFDVDLFWIGRTNANKRKPFIIADDVVYIDSACIADASITNAKIQTLSADKIDTRGLSIKDMSGNILLSAGNALNISHAAPGTVNADLSSAITNASLNADWAHVAGAGKPQDNATWGASFGSNIGGQITVDNVWTYIASGAIGNAHIGNAQITSAKILDLEVGTLKIAGNAVSFGGCIVGGGTHGFYSPVGGTLSVIAYSGGSFNQNPLYMVADGDWNSVPAGAAVMNGSGEWQGTYGPTSGCYSWNLGAGSHSIGLAQNEQAYASARLIWIFFQR